MPRAKPCPVCQTLMKLELVRTENGLFPILKCVKCKHEEAVTARVPETP